MASKYEDLCKIYAESRERDQAWVLEMRRAPDCLRRVLASHLGIEADSFRVIPEDNSRPRILGLHYPGSGSPDDDRVGLAPATGFVDEAGFGIFSLGILLEMHRDTFPKKRYQIQCAALADKGLVKYVLWNPADQKPEGSRLDADAFAELVIEKLGHFLSFDVSQGDLRPGIGFY